MTTPEYRRWITGYPWACMRADQLARAGHRCCVCRHPARPGTPLQVHHITYERLGHERADDLRVVCAVCHRGADFLRRQQRDPRIRIRYPARFIERTRRLYGEVWIAEHPAEWRRIVAFVEAHAAVQPGRAS